MKETDDGAWVPVDDLRTLQRAYTALQQRHDALVAELGGLAKEWHTIHAAVESAPFALAVRPSEEDAPAEVTGMPESMIGMRVRIVPCEPNWTIRDSTARYVPEKENG